MEAMRHTSFIIISNWTLKYLDLSRRDAVERALGGSSSEDSVLSTLAEVPCSPEGPASLSRSVEYGF